MAAAVMFGAVACSQSDEIQEVVGGEEVVSVLSLELEDLGTRLAGDAGKIDKVAWGIYDKDGQFLAPHSSANKGVANFTGGKAEIEVRLFTGKVYDLVFFAYCSENNAYSIDWGARQLNVSYKLNEQQNDLANLEARDAFFHIENGFVAGPNKTFTLKRPFAQLNAGQSLEDYNNMQLTDNCIIKSQLTTEAYAAMNLKTGKVVGEKVEVVLEMNDVIDTDNNGNDHLIVGDTEYKHLAMNYLLVNEKELVDVKLELLGNEGTKFVRDYYNVPLQRNYRTNILGSLISEPSVFTILIDAEFDGDNVYEVTPWDGKSVSEPEYDAATKTYTVSNGAELAWIAHTVNGTSTTAANPLEGQNIILANDINLGDYPWTPIGSAKNDHGFMANFDGNGHAVKNLNITNITPDADGYVYAGLFGVTEGTAANHNKIENLIIENVNINVKGDIAAAAVAYPYYTDLYNITVKGKINIVARDYTAGIVSYTRRCVVASNLTIAGDEGSVISGRRTVGGVISDIQMNGGLTAQYTNFNASGLKITAEKSVGGISGIIAQNLTVATVKNVQIVCGDIQKGKVAGSFGGKPVINDLVVENVTGAEFLVGANYDQKEDTIIVINGKKYIYKGNGTYLVDGVYETSTIEGLQNILNNAAGETVINLVADLNGDVTVAQSAGVKITINGNNHNYKGVIVVDGKSATYTTAALTINNVNFNAEAISADACIRLGNGTNATRYTCNVTVNGCTFDVAGAVGVKSYTGGDKNLKVLNSTATEKAHSLLQAKGIDGILVEGCVIKSKNGLNFNNSTNVTVEQCVADVKGYAVRFGEGSAANGASETYTIKNSELKSACEEAGDAVIVLRGTADKAVLNLVTTTLEGTNQIANNANAVVIIDGVANISEADALNVVLASNLEDVTINLKKDVNYGATTVGELKDVTIIGAENAVMNFVTDADSKLENVTLNGVNFVYDGSNANSGIVINANAKIEKLVVDGCSFVGTGEKKGRGIYGQNPTANIELKNCNFKQLGYPIYTMAAGGYKSLIIKSCTFEEIKSWAIMPQYNDYAGDLTVTGCQFVNCVGGLVKAGKFTAGHTFTFTDNTITNSAEHPAKNWFAIDTTAANKVVSGNTKDGATWTPAEAEGLK